MLLRSVQKVQKVQGFKVFSILHFPFTITPCIDHLSKYLANYSLPFREGMGVGFPSLRGRGQGWGSFSTPAAPLVRRPSLSGCLHTVCAPPSSITILTSSPREEYEIRKQESKRHAESLGLQWIDGDYDHEQWQHDICGLEHEPERGRRCEQCFTLRLIASARKAQELNMTWFTTTLASSRWKSIEQITRAGQAAEAAVPGTHFWAQNWRKGGLYERRNQLLREYNFYNQQYCGCEFSMRKEP